ncbi:MAG: hypothetical protein R3D45_14435 [Rhizobiaceae bacterium]
MRRRIAAIEDRPPERFTVAAGQSACPASGGTDARAGTVLLRQGGMPAIAAGPAPVAANRNATVADVVATGAAGFDRALGGGLARAALCEIHGLQARDAGAVTGFALALASLARRSQAGAGAAPLLWVGAADLAGEAGFPHAPAIEALFGIPDHALLFARARRPLDALWIAGEAAGLAALAAVIVEIRGDPASLDLTATRRLQRRARAAGRPVFLLRLSAAPAPTAAPVRFRVAAAHARPREIFGRPLPGSLGMPAFAVTIDKCRANPGRQFMLEWNTDEHRLHPRQPQDPVAVVPVSADRQDHAPAPRPVVARRPGDRRQAG